MRQELHLLSAAADIAVEAVHWTEHASTRAGLDGDRAADLATAVIEAVNNSLEHAYGLAPGNVDLTLDGYADRVVVTVTDHGSGLPPRPASTPPRPLAERGRGSWIMRCTCDEVRHEFEAGSQTVVLVKLRTSTDKTLPGDST